MSSFIDNLLRKAKPPEPITAAGIDFDCLILEQPPQEWELIRQRISERTLQSSFDKGDLALIAENAILWYDRLRRDSRNERCIRSTSPRSTRRRSPLKARSGSPGLTSPPAYPPAAEVNISTVAPAAPVASPVPTAEEASVLLSPTLTPGQQTRLRDALEQETYLETLHNVLRERTKRVIRCACISVVEG